jgi:simple sugar transport system permease protein
LSELTHTRGGAPRGAAAATPPDRRPQETRGSRARRLLLRPETASLAGFLCVLVGFGVTTPLFLTTKTFVSITSVAAELGVLSIGVTLLMIAGHFDLSVGSVLGVCSYVAVDMSKHSLPPLVAVLLALLAGTALGTLNGVLVVRTNLHSFVITLGTMLAYRGLLTAFTSGFPVSVTIQEPVATIFNGQLPGGFSASVLWLLGVVVVATLFLLRTRMGNWVSAVGQNPAAARNLGVPVRRVSVTMFAVAGLCAGLAGVIDAVQFGSVDALRGENDELLAIAITVIGGTLLTGGYGSAIGSLFGALIFGMIQVGLVLAKAPGYYYNTLVGILIVVAVVFNTYAARVIANRRTNVQDDGPGDEDEAPRLAMDVQGAQR